MSTVESNTDILLGKHTEYVNQYDASLLFPIARQQSREVLNLNQSLPFVGQDLWTGYELSWLNPKGKPQVAVAEFSFAADSTNIVESKSFKLYLNSFNQSPFESWAEVEKTLTDDLSKASGGPVIVKLMSLSEARQWSIRDFSAQVGVEHLDDLDVAITDYTPNAALLKAQGESEQVSLTSDLLKSNCPVTGQPDWASVQIVYRGPKIDREGLLRYIVSFREHQDFHEHCVERMFVDITECCQPEFLSVYARYTRRGGLDINPYRASLGSAIDAPSLRLPRQ